MRLPCRSGATLLREADGVRVALRGFPLRAVARESRLGPAAASVGAGGGGRDACWDGTGRSA